VDGDVTFLIDVEKFTTVCKVDMETKFEMKDIDMMHCFLGLEI
jgi:hypothetical protein